IVERDLFEKVQAKLPTRTIGQGRSYQSSHLLTGLVVCRHCGYKFSGASTKGNRHEYRYYSCTGYQRAGESVCRSVHVSADELEHLALDAIRHRIKSMDWKQELKPTLKGLLKDHMGEDGTKRLEELKKALENVERQIRNTVEAIKAGVLKVTLHEEAGKL